MHTISFYSYKGGVGRSLAVHYFAKQLGEFGKRVVVADFDFEAPGLHHKFKIPQSDIRSGIVDYVHAFCTESRIPDSIGRDCKIVPGMGTERYPVLLLPAGASYSHGYWQKLHEIDWKKLLFQPNSFGRAFFLEWKLRLEEELKPDVLLIDARTGIHDLTAVTMHLLSDQVLVLGVNNDENIDGCRLLLETLKDRHEPMAGNPRIAAHFALTRLPVPGPYFSYKKEQEICQNTKAHINAGRRVEDGNLVDTVHVIHSDDRLLIDEKRLTEDPREDLWRIERDLLRVFYEISRKGDFLAAYQLRKLQDATQVDLLILQIISDMPSEPARELLDKALKIAPDDVDINLLHGLYHFEHGNYDVAIPALDLVIELNATSHFGYFYRSRTKESLDDIEGAILDAETAATLRPEQQYLHLHIGRLRARLNQLDLAVDAYQRCLALDPHNFQALIGLAETYFELGNLGESKLALEKAAQIHATDNRVVALEKKLLG